MVKLEVALMARYLRYAAIDGPAGMQAVTAPADRLDALVLRDRERFWCTTAAAGCGQPLTLKAGPQVPPYFSHLHGAANGCALASDPDRAERSYRHLVVQEALMGWLRAQGFQPRMEARLSSGGRADLHVVVDEQSQSIEVQLSHISREDWRARQDRYRRDVDHVTWLFGNDAELMSATRVALTGWSLAIRSRGGGVEIGVRNQTRIAWSALSECRLGPEGVWTPHLQDVQSEGVNPDAATLTEPSPPPQHRQRPVAPAPDVQPFEKPAPPPQGVQSSLDGDRLLAHSWAFPEFATWTPQQGWDWLRDLPEGLRPAARFFAYACQQLYTAGPATLLQLSGPQGADDRIRSTLEQAGMLHETKASTGLARWART
jgi:hypothetical protein